MELTINKLKKLKKTKHIHSNFFLKQKDEKFYTNGKIFILSNNFNLNADYDIVEFKDVPAGYEPSYKFIIEQLKVKFIPILKIKETFFVIEKEVYKLLKIFKIRKAKTVLSPTAITISDEEAKMIYEESINTNIEKNINLDSNILSLFKPEIIYFTDEFYFCELKEFKLLGQIEKEVIKCF